MLERLSTIELKALARQLSEQGLDNTLRLKILVELARREANAKAPTKH